MSRERQLQASGPDAYGPRRVLPAMTGQSLMPSGTCPGCGRDSHVLRTCDGKGFDEVIAILRESPVAVFVSLEPRR